VFFHELAGRRWHVVKALLEVIGDFPRVPTNRVAVAQRIDSDCVFGMSEFGGQGPGHLNQNCFSDTAFYVKYMKSHSWLTGTGHLLDRVEQNWLAKRMEFFFTKGNHTGSH
jgi:hypothetical protein